MADDQKAIYQMSLTPGMGYITGPEGEKAVKEVISKDKDCSYRLIVNIVGRERQGKTSLRKLLSNDEFDENEESTVGVDHELVDTVGLEPNLMKHWMKTDMREANESEYDEIVGKHVKIRLDNVKSKKLLAPVFICIKIAIMTLIAFAIYTGCIYCEILRDWPWFGMLINFMFIISVPVHGIQDGTGIATGVRHLVVLIDAWFRWDPETQFLESDSIVGMAITFCVMLARFLSLEVVASVMLGSSLGVGVACSFFLCSMPPCSRYSTTNPFFSLEVHVFHLGCITGLLLYNYCNFKIIGLLSIVLAILMQVQPGLFFTLLISIVIGSSHNYGLKIGQNMYCTLDKHFKRFCTSSGGRRLLRHLFGILFGLVNTQMFGWELAPDWKKILTVIALIILMEILKMKSASIRNSIKGNETQINHPSNVIGARTRSPRLKLLVRDFAGHPLYYTAHQLYMTGQCVYLLVFSLVDAMDDFHLVSQDIERWLRSIQLHSQYPLTRVFLVGSHRDDSKVTRTIVRGIKENLKKIIHRKYQNMIVWNEDETPLFPIENSSRNEMDKDHKHLKDKIIDETRSIIMLEKFPVKFFFFFTIIEYYRKENVLTDTLNNVYTLCKDKKFCIAAEDEFEDMLIFFHKMGEIMYRNDNDDLNKLIIFDPRSLLNIVGHLINVPRICDRPADLISDWSTLQDHGICSDKLFNHILKQYSPPNIKRECILSALVRFHLICKMSTSYIISSALSNELPYPVKCWSIREDDRVFYIKCQPYFPEELFLYLICACAEFDLSSNDNDGLYPNMCRHKAIFTYKSESCYQLELCEEDKCLKIVLREDEQNTNKKVLSVIWKCLWKIVAQDFKMCKLTFGCLCPRSSPHEDGSEDKHLLAIANVMGSPNEPLAIPSKLEFWCCGQKISVINGKPCAKIQQSLQTEQKWRLNKGEINIKDQGIMDVPYNVYQSICTSLNIPNPLGRDWEMLAGLLHFSVKEVDIIKFKHPNDPCSAVLKLWHSRQPNVKWCDLIQLLKEMDRVDIICMIENQEFN